MAHHFFGTIIVVAQMGVILSASLAQDSWLAH
jgi:hypothetical protein